MKNRMKKELQRELGGVHVSGRLKQSILAEAAASRAPSAKKSGFSIRPLAIAAAVMVTFGLTAGMIALRTEKPDLSVTPLTAAQTKQSHVWVGEDVFYHGEASCGDQQDMTRMSLEKARAEGRKACAACIDENSAVADDLVWMNNYDHFYHATKNCSELESAFGVLEIEAKTFEKMACPVCAGGKFSTLAPWPTTMPTPGAIVETEEMPTAMPTQHPQATPEPEQYVMPTAAATEEPTHATQGEEFNASSMAVVMDEEGDASVWMTDGGLYYHYDEDCSGMEGAHICTPEEAVEAGKILCMVCVPEKMQENSADGPTAISVTQIGGADGPTAVWIAQEDASVWMTDGGLYYHSDEHCSGMEGAHDCNVVEALAKGKTPCPKCSKQLSRVWATKNGMYYHLNADCSGMTGAEEMSGNDAVMQGKTLCPSCRSEIAEAAVSAMEQYE